MYPYRLIEAYTMPWRNVRQKVTIPAKTLLSIEAINYQDCYHRVDEAFVGLGLSLAGCFWQFV